jgi:hypothetical protein
LFFSTVKDVICWYLSCINVFQGLIFLGYLLYALTWCL